MVKFNNLESKFVIHFCKLVISFTSVNGFDLNIERCMDRKINEKK